MIRIMMIRIMIIRIMIGTKDIQQVDMEDSPEVPSDGWTGRPESATGRLWAPLDAMPARW